jgi:hypothetical protein
MFRRTREAAVRVETSLLTLRREQKDLDNIRPSGGWLKLIEAGDPGADINVFFMPWSGTAANAPSRMFGVDGNCVCPDDIPLSTVSLALAHMVGYLLGCNVIHDDRRRHHLMHWSGDKDDTILSIDNVFISRDCANTMNGP